jgi:hypothetical protein
MVSAHDILAEEEQSLWSLCESNIHDWYGMHVMGNDYSSSSCMLEILNWAFEWMSPNTTCMVTNGQHQP